MFNLSLRNKSTEQLWKLHREDFLKIYASEQGLKIGHVDLEKWFIDSLGKQYYKFPKLMALPIERMGKLNELYSHLSAGISGSEMAKLTSAMDLILSQGIGKPEIASKLGAIVHILKERQKLIFHTEILYNILAVQAIREDERPDVYNNQIQMEKVTQFKEEVAQSNAHFFFHQIQLQTPIDLLRLSQSEWTALWHDSVVSQEALGEMLDLILTFKESKNQKQTSVSN